MTREEYRRSPCGASSLPFWKSAGMRLPEDVRAVRDDAFDPAAWPGWRDERYFKLMADPAEAKRPILPAGFAVAMPTPAQCARHIARCYARERAAEEELEAYRARATYAPFLWLALTDGTTRTVAASGIGEIDRETGEGTLEWIQVTPEHRRRGLGEWLVREMLWRMRGQADFCTVSGRLDSPDNPLSLYERCGFAGRVIWHILRRENP